MHTSSQNEELLKLGKLEDALIVEREKLTKWVDRVQDDLHKLRTTRAKLLCPYQVGDIISIRLRSTPTATKCKVVGIKPKSDSWGYLIETKAILLDNKLCSTIVTIQKSGAWSLIGGVL